MIDVPMVDVNTVRVAMEDPSEAMMRTNWFASCASLFRADRVEFELLDLQLKYFEWTYLFYLLVSKGKKIHFIPATTYRRYADNPHSVSRTSEYARAYPEFLVKLIELQLPSGIRQRLQRKRAIALNGLSQLELANGNLAGAWRAHLKCLSLGGFQFLPYTRHILRGRCP